jgi:hypothetical protein
MPPGQIEARFIEPMLLLRTEKLPEGGYYQGGKLMYAGRTRSGFTPSSRAQQLFKRFATLATETCPFANLPEAKGGRWGEGLTAEKMRESRIETLVVARPEV